MSYTQHELANLELVRAFRSAPMSERHLYTVEGYASSRHGLANLAAITGQHKMTPDAIPDRSDDIIDMIAHGDEVWAVWTVKGTHQGTLLGIEATGRPIEMLEMGRWTIQDGKIATGWFMADELALVRQLGFRT